MQQKKKRPIGRLVVLALIVVLAVTVIVAKNLTKDAELQTQALRQELSDHIVENEALKAVYEDADAYKQQFDAVIRITGDSADPANVSAGLSSSAMENAARGEGYVFPGESVFKDSNQE